jgi:muramoyltetrapeptide carboxypeptidase LdcA involved in peptidoglycan recycling
VAVTLALAHTIQRAIDRGEIRDQSAAARRLGVTRARMTQILDLTYLAPTLQEEILFLEAVGDVEPLSERSLRNRRQTPWSRDLESAP